MSTAVYIIVMAGVTYLIRMLPFSFFNKKIKNVYIRSFLKYIPYAVLSAMTIPAIFYCTDNMPAAAIGTAAAVILAFFNCPLIVVALVASLAAYLAGMFF